MATTGPTVEMRSSGHKRQREKAPHAIHARGIIHRDLKPANVIVRQDAGTSAIKPLDFGVSGLRRRHSGDRRPTSVQ